MGRRRVRPPGVTKHTLDLPDALWHEAYRVARERGTTITALVCEGLSSQVREATALRNDAEMAPVINRLIQHALKSHRTLTVRIGYEVLRQQFVLWNFLVTAGISEKEIAKWGEEGWEWAVKQFRQVPEDLDSAHPSRR